MSLTWMRQRLDRGGAGGERGASLILALVFMTFFAVIVVALLGFAQAGFLASAGVHNQGVNQYSMSGAIDAEIHRLRRDSSTGGCATPLTYAGVSVTCAPVAGTGADPTKPTNAILARSGGITTTGPLAVTGPIFASGTISASGPVEAADWPVTAVGGCGVDPSTWTVPAPILSCGNDPTGGAGADPGYAARTGDSTIVTKANCSAGTPRIVVYTPGRYVDTKALATPGGCSSPVARYFQPGVYYFDFGGAGCTGGNCATTVWTVDAIRIVAGAPKGWSPGSSSPPAIGAASGLTSSVACSTAPGVQGVQFVFVGASRMTLDAGASVEICPYQNANSGNEAGGRVSMHATGATPFPAMPAGATFLNWGTVYTPNAALTVDVSTDNKRFDRGVIANSLQVNGGVSGRAVFRLGTSPREVTLTATSGARRVDALVRFTDYATPGYWTRVKRWSVRR